MLDDEMNENAFRQISRELAPGERLLWCGRPRTGIRTGWKAAIHLFAGVAGFGLLVVLIWGLILALSEKEVVGVIIFLGLVLGVGLNIVNLINRGPLGRARTAYGLTDRRVIIIPGLLFPAVSVPFSRFLEIELHERWDGTGTIRAITVGPILSTPGKQPKTKQRTVFRMIGDAQQVHALLVHAMAQSGAPEPNRLPVLMNAMQPDRSPIHWIDPASTGKRTVE